MRSAELPGQALKADLCFVAATHTMPTSLPAVSGSSARLVVAPHRLAAEPTYPVQVFADPERPYAEAMQVFVAASPPRIAPPVPPAAADAPDSTPLLRVGFYI